MHTMRPSILLLIFLHTFIVFGMDLAAQPVNEDAYVHECPDSDCAPACDLPAKPKCCRKTVPPKCMKDDDMFPLVCKDECKVDAAPATNVGFEALIAGVKALCTEEVNDFTAHPLNAIPAKDKCLIDKMFLMFKDRIAIADCEFSDDVILMCAATTPGTLTKWKDCANLMKAYENKDNCAGADEKPLKAWAGQMLGVDAAIRFLNYGTTRHCKCSDEAKKEIRMNGAKHKFNTIFTRTASVCAPVAYAGFYALVQAGVEGSLEVIQEYYGGGSGHVFLLYSTNPIPNLRNSGARQPCGTAASGAFETTCFATYVDFWYNGLSEDGLYEPYEYEPDEIDEQKKLEQQARRLSIKPDRPNKWVTVRQKIVQFSETEVAKKADRDETESQELFETSQSARPRVSVNDDEVKVGATVSVQKPTTSLTVFSCVTFVLCGVFYILNKRKQENAILSPLLDDDNL